jgi:hypothetical protein
MNLEVRRAIGSGAGSRGITCADEFRAGLDSERFNATTDNDLADFMYHMPNVFQYEESWLCWMKLSAGRMSAEKRVNAAGTHFTTYGEGDFRYLLSLPLKKLQFPNLCPS